MTETFDPSQYIACQLSDALARKIVAFLREKHTGQIALNVSEGKIVNADIISKEHVRNS